jgi:ribosomal protein S12 methylthiotransferase
VKRKPPEPPGGRPPRIEVVSLGCAKNLVDTEIMLGHLDRAGCVVAADGEEADVILVNTCSFIDEARAESVRAILDAAARKRDGSARRVVVAGCLVQRYPDELRREVPEVDAFLGLDQLDRIVTAVGASPTSPPRSDLPVLAGNGPVRSIALYGAESPRLLTTPPWTAYVKIAEGCDHTCSFCAIPAFRGTFRSRPPDDVVAEAERLAASGVREINLIAQDTSHYGRDRGREEGLSHLLERLDGVELLRWIRVHYLYPNTVTPRLIDAMARLPRVVPYVDMPLQHAHPDVLRRMRRGGSAGSHLALLERFRRAIPGCALRTTLIVGYPGESEEEFRTLADFVREARFDHLGVFAYSHEDSTAAHAETDDVAPEVKDERRARILEIQREIAYARNAARVGAVEEVLVEGPHAETEHLLAGRLATQAREVDGQVLINDGFAHPGSFARVEITDTAGYDLVGRVLGHG